MRSEQDTTTQDAYLTLKGLLADDIDTVDEFYASTDRPITRLIELARESRVKDPTGACFGSEEAQAFLSGVLEPRRAAEIATHEVVCERCGGLIGKQADGADERNDAAIMFATIEALLRKNVTSEADSVREMAVSSNAKNGSELHSNLSVIVVNGHELVRDTHDLLASSSPSSPPSFGAATHAEPARAALDVHSEDLGVPEDVMDKGLAAVTDQPVPVSASRASIPGSHHGAFESTSSESPVPPPTEVARTLAEAVTKPGPKSAPFRKIGPAHHGLHERLLRKVNWSVFRTGITATAAAALLIGIKIISTSTHIHAVRNETISAHDIKVTRENNRYEASIWLERDAEVFVVELLQNGTVAMISPRNGEPIHVTARVTTHISLSHDEIANADKHNLYVIALSRPLMDVDPSLAQLVKDGCGLSNCPTNDVMDIHIRGTNENALTFGVVRLDVPQSIR
jgi:hypothetical protein